MPFDPKLISWRVLSTTRGRDGLRGQVVAFADPRAYTDRLNELFSPSGWTRRYGVRTVNNVERASSNKGHCITGKILVTCTLTIFDLGTHSGTGEEWADDANAMTSAEAQAFKRACVCFGLGRYLYDLPRSWVALDESRRIVGQLPKLPEWAVPATSGNGSGRRPAAPAERGVGDDQSSGNARTNGRRRGLPRTPADFIVKIRRLEATVGIGLFHYCVRSLAAVDVPENVTDARTLRGILERLQNVAKGVTRLQAAVEATGYETYADLARQMNLASGAVDDIPDITTLRKLLQALEQGAAGKGGAPIT